MCDIRGCRSCLAQPPATSCEPFGFKYVPPAIIACRKGRFRLPLTSPLQTRDHPAERGAEGQGEQVLEQPRRKDEHEPAAFDQRRKARHAEWHEEEPEQTPPVEPRGPDGRARAQPE